MKRIRNKMEWSEKDHQKEKVNPESETIQGDTFSIAEMMQRLAAGMPLTKKNGMYMYEDGQEDEAHEDFDLEKVGNMDISEHEELLDEARQTMLKFEELKEQKREREEDEKVEEKEENEEEDKLD